MTLQVISNSEPNRSFRQKAYAMFQELYSLADTSTGNSTTTPLSSGATFTGEAEQNDLPDVMASCYSDTDGTLYFDFSINGTDWRTFPSAGFVVIGGIHEFHTAVKGPRHFRARFVNSATGQTTFQLATYYGTFRPPSAPLNQAQSLDSDAILVRPTNVEDEIILGLRSGVTHFNKFCYRDTTTAAAGEQTVWSHNSNFVVMTSADTFDIVYNSGTDGSGQTGARVLLISYIDANFELQSATHVLGSTGTDTTAFSGLGINRVVVVSAGTAKTNTNAITISDTAGTVGVQAHVPASASITQQSVFHMPINHTGILRQISINCNKLSGGGAPRITFRMRVYNRLVGVEFELIKVTVDTSVENTVQIPEPTGFPITGRDVVYWTMDTDTNNTIASLRYAFNIYGVVP